MTSQYLTTMFSLSGKTAIATGPTGGLGLEMTVALANTGCDIVSIKLPSDPRAPLLKDAVAATGRTLTVFHCNVSDSAAIRATSAAIWKAGIVLDVLLNCAGIQRRGPVEDLKDGDIDAVFAVNLKESYVAAQEFGRRLLELKRHGRCFRFHSIGKIINIASIIAFIANINISPYACTKGGVLQMTKAFSNEWSSKGINVNYICHGYMKADMTAEYFKDQKYVDYILGRTPAGRWGAPEDLEGAVIFLASLTNNYVTGTSIVVDGGLIAK